jgi:hypothetical protein
LSGGCWRDRLRHGRRSRSLQGCIHGVRASNCPTRVMASDEWQVT